MCTWRPGWRRCRRRRAGPDESVTLAMALTVRAIRNGSVCLDLAAVESDSEQPELPWPRCDEWVAALRASPLLATPPVLRLYGDRLLYLDRYWLEEEQVCAELLGRLGGRSTGRCGRDGGRTGLGCFTGPAPMSSGPPHEIALSQLTTVLTGGPGTGKTTTVAGLLALLAEQAETRRAPWPAYRVGRADREGVGPAAGGGPTGDRQSAGVRSGPADRIAGRHVAPPAGRTAGHLDPVQASPR